MAGISETIEVAVQHHQAGRLRQAEQLYQLILQTHPNHPTALHSLGMIAYQAEKHDIAVELIGKAIANSPRTPQFHNTIGIAFEALGKLEEAIGAYQQAVSLKPDYAEAYNNMAIALQSQGQFPAAVEKCKQAVLLKPDYAEAYNTMAFALQMQGQYAEAIENYTQAVQLKPDFAEAYNHLGVVLNAQGRHAEAIENYNRALRLEPDYAEVYNNLGITLKAQGQYTEAIENYKQAIRLEPDFAEAYYNLANALRDQEQLADATENYKQAVRLKPDFAEAHYNLANTLRDRRQLAEAIENYKRAIRLKPDFAEAHWNHSSALLLSGRLAEGWKEYEWRRYANLDTTTYPHRYEMPRWDGSSFIAKRLFVHYEQGLGDTLQFVRYLPMVKARGGTVIFEARKPLLGLLRGFPGIDELVEASPNRKPTIKFDFYVSILDLPGIFGTTLETIPAEVPYLHADPCKAEYWQSRIAGEDFKVGIVWAGQPAQKNDRNRSCSLEWFAPLAQIPHVRLYGLQKGEAAAEAAELSDKIAVTNLAEQCEDFTDTAAVIENLDLVVSVDTAVAHLAGAMGKPVWVPLCFLPTWRYMLDRQDSPWYPTMRLFRQKKRGHWDDVFERVAEELRLLAGKQKIKSQKSEYFTG